METTAKLRHIRIAPRKVRMLVDEIRGKTINDALTYLKFSPRKKIGKALYGLLRSAVSNADKKGVVDIDTLFVKRIFVGAGPTFKRFATRAKGAASPIWKRTAHVTVILAEK